MVDDRIAENRRAQQAAYGEPLSASFDRMKRAFDLNQTELAAVLGLSTPMLSQLNSGQRVKIGNPAVLNRMYQLNALVEEHASGQVAAEQLPERLVAIQTSQGSMGTTTQVLAGQASDASVVAGVRNLLHAVASGAELRDAAALLEDSYPKLAEVLRLYGIGPAHPAVEHYVEHKELF